VLVRAAVLATRCKSEVAAVYISRHNRPEGGANSPGFYIKLAREVILMQRRIHEKVKLKTNYAEFVIKKNFLYPQESSTIPQCLTLPRKVKNKKET